MLLNSISSCYLRWVLGFLPSGIAILCNIIRVNGMQSIHGFQMGMNEWYFSVEEMWLKEHSC